MLGLPGLGVPELLLLLVLALIIFGPGKLPEVGRSVGRAMQEFRHATSEIKKEYVEGMEKKAVTKEEADSQA